MTNEKYFVTVLLPISVAEGKYCWEPGNRCCEHFDNHHCDGECDMGFGRLSCDTKGNYKKPTECFELSLAEKNDA